MIPLIQTGQLIIVHENVIASRSEDFCGSFHACVPPSCSAIFSDLWLRVNVDLILYEMYSTKCTANLATTVSVKYGLQSSQSSPDPDVIYACDKTILNFSLDFMHKTKYQNSIHIYIYIYIDKNVFKTTRSFCYQWFHVSTLQANATKHGKTTLNLWIVVNRIKCKRFLNSKPITRRRYIHTFIYERLFLACQTFQISNFTSEYTPLTSQNAHTSSFKATYHDGDTIYY